jgi:hypothetical protein
LEAKFAAQRLAEEGMLLTSDQMLQMDEFAFDPFQAGSDRMADPLPGVATAPAPDGAGGSAE